MTDQEILGAAMAYTDKHSGEGGTSNYNDLENKPKIAGTTLSGNKSLEDLGIQASLSAGDYIQFNGNEISVIRDIAKNSIRRYVFRGSESTRYIDTYLDDELVETVSMYYTASTRNFNDEISVGYDGTSKWLITNLKASTTKPQGYVEQRGFYDSSEYTQSFEIVLHAGDKLVIKDELDAAIAGKASAIPYSTSEVDTGVDWVDGNRVYKRVFPITLGGAGDKDDLLISGLVPTAAWIESSDFIYYLAGEQFHIYLGSCIGGSWTTGWLLVKNGNLYLRTNNSFGGANGASGYVTVCYTKSAT